MKIIQNLYQPCPHQAMMIIYPTQPNPNVNPDLRNSPACCRLSLLLLYKYQKPLQWETGIYESVEITHLFCAVFCQPQPDRISVQSHRAVFRLQYTAKLLVPCSRDMQLTPSSSSPVQLQQFSTDSMLQNKTQLHVLRRYNFHPSDPFQQYSVRVPTKL